MEEEKKEQRQPKRSFIALLVIFVIGIAVSIALKFCVREFGLGDFWDEFAFLAPAGWVSYVAGGYYYGAKPFSFKQWVLFFVAMLLLSWIFSLI